MPSRALVVSLALLVLPRVAFACSTCMDPREGNRMLLSVTIVLSLLPLCLMAGIGAYVWSRVRRAERLATLSPLPETE
ncbi:hypothetical protein LBMAG42_23020 [Deltaproteobacteria bacterium]|nr:hypothetical protein LBMAG42_23020 [Deltaproteobacteria bacterium]